MSPPVYSPGGQGGPPPASRDDDGLVDGNEVLDVDERVLPAVHLEVLERLGDELAQVLAALLAVVDAVAQVVVRPHEDVEHREDLAVVRHEGLPDEMLALGHAVARHEGLEDLQHLHDHRLGSGVERRLDGND